MLWQRETEADSEEKETKFSHTTSFRPSVLSSSMERQEEKIFRKRKVFDSKQDVSQLGHTNESDSELVAERNFSLEEEGKSEENVFQLYSEEKGV